MKRRKRIVIWEDFNKKPTIEPSPPVDIPVSAPPATIARTSQPQINRGSPQATSKSYITPVVPPPEKLLPPDKFPEELQKVTPRKKKPFPNNSVRNVQLKVIVTAAEAEYLRRAAEENNQTFSSWARRNLLRAAPGRSPKRKTRY